MYVRWGVLVPGGYFGRRTELTEVSGGTAGIEFIPHITVCIQAVLDLTDDLDRVSTELYPRYTLLRTPPDTPLAQISFSYL